MCFGLAQVQRFNREQVLDLLMGQGDFEGSQKGMAPFVNNGKQSSITRVRQAVRDKIVVPWLTHKTGTLLVVVGLRNQELVGLLKELDSFTDVAEARSANSSAPKDTDLMKLPAFLRFKTILGHPLHRDSLRKAGFPQADLGECFNDNPNYTKCEML